MSENKLINGNTLQDPMKLKIQHSADSKNSKYHKGAMTPERPSLSLKTISGAPTMGRRFFVSRKNEQLEKINESISRESNSRRSKYMSSD